MKAILQNILLASTALLFSCTPLVRFASNTVNTQQQQTNTTKSASKQTCVDEDKLVRNAERWIGVPYQYGGINENGIDCSAFVQNVYSYCGISVPRTAAEQYDFSQKLGRTDYEVGDLVFFQKNSNQISHVGIVVGKNEVIHASTSRGVVREKLDTGYLSSMLVGFGRVCQK